MKTTTEATPRGLAFIGIGQAFAAVREASAAMLADDDDTAAARVAEAVRYLEAAHRQLS